MYSYLEKWKDAFKKKSLANTLLAARVTYKRLYPFCLLHLSSVTFVVAEIWIGSFVQT